MSITYEIAITTGFFIIRRNVLRVFIIMTNLYFYISVNFFNADLLQYRDRTLVTFSFSLFFLFCGDRIESPVEYVTTISVHFFPSHMALHVGLRVTCTQSRTRIKDSTTKDHRTKTWTIPRVCHQPDGFALSFLCSLVLAYSVCPFVIYSPYSSRWLIASIAAVYWFFNDFSCFSTEIGVRRKESV